MKRRRTRRRRAAVILATMVGVLAGCTSSPPPGGAAPTGPTPGPAPSGPAPGPTGSNANPSGLSPDPSGTRPNIVFVLTDDLSWNLVQYMPQVQQMQKEGLTFDQFMVTDSLCCPSRTSIFTGQYPHDTGVFTNGKEDGGKNDGGYAVFNQQGNEVKSFAPALQKGGYRTGFMGKYLNGYVPVDTNGTSKPYVPPGWDEWVGAGSAYEEYNYALNENGTVRRYGREPADYLTDVLAAKGTAFIDSSAAAGKPFALEIATFAPHTPATPAPRHANDFPDLRAPRGPAYGVAPSNPPAWLAAYPPMSPQNAKNIDGDFLKRVRSVQAVDELIGRIRAELKAKGLADNTYLVFGSDNGYHMGEHNLRPGKQTAFDTDIRVPLVVVGPRVPSNRTRSELVGNIDLHPTFLQLGGLTPTPDVDGRSLVPMLRGEAVTDWRQALLVEHHGPDRTKDDPDKPPPLSGNPPSYSAVRTTTATYVEYADGGREYYDQKADPDQLHNLAGSLSPQQLDSLHRLTGALTSCHGTQACWAAGRQQ